MIFRESGLTFAFSDEWHVVQWDQHTYFKGLSGVGLKGVDFLAFHPDKRTFLMEVKNYRDTEPPHARTLAEDVWQKAQDTLRGLEAVKLFLQRSWLRRLLLPIWKIYPPDRSDRAFWTQASHFFSQGNTHSYLIWLEGKNIPPAWEKSFLARLEELQIDSSITFSINNQGVSPYSAIVRKLSE